MTDLREASDAALVMAIGRWRDDALAEAYRRHAGSVFGLAHRLLANRTIAEDVVQEVFLRLWNEPDRFDPQRGSLRSYLLAQTHGRSVDLLRAEGARRRREERDVRSVAESGRGIDEEVFDIVMAETVKEVLSGLPDAERVAIEMAYFSGCTYQETAVRLGEPEGTIKSRIRSGLKRMRASLPGSEVVKP
jgi:RNA polymerase sigma-70 factor, ECF subfamily